MHRQRISFIFLNIGHFFDHLFLLIFATVAALILTTDWGLSYAELIPYATPSFIAFGACSIPAGWIADKWSREGMMVIFFVGIGASSILTGQAQTPVQMSIGLTAIGAFAAIYHPVGLAMVVEGRTKIGIPLAINGVWGNLGVASAALLTGFLIDMTSWRIAFWLPGAVAILTGAAYFIFIQGSEVPGKTANVRPVIEPPFIERNTLIRLFAIIFFSTAIGGMVFQSTTFALPKVFAERLGDFAPSATMIGWYAFLVFAIGALAQLVIGYLLDRQSVRLVFVVVAATQMVLFTIMQQLTGLAALIVAIGFMLVVFGQIPINDVLIGRIAKSEWRSRVYAFRYLMTFSVMATSVPIIAWIHANWGFDRLFLVLAVVAGFILVAVFMLPKYSSVVQAQPAE